LRIAPEHAQFGIRDGAFAEGLEDGASRFGLVEAMEGERDVALALAVTERKPVGARLSEEVVDGFPGGVGDRFILEEETPAVEEQGNERVEVGVGELVAVFEILVMAVDPEIQAVERTDRRVERGIDAEVP
jgi:hypothetical protein